MSDDTPTQRLPEPSGDNPTERISTAEVHEDLQEEKQKNKGLMIGLIIAGALLLVAIIVLVVVLIPKGSGDPQAGNTQSPPPLTTQTPAPSESASPTPAATEEPTDEPAPPQQPSGPAITSFTVSPGTVYCNTQAPVQPQNQYLSISWKTVGADEIRIGTYDPYGDYSTRYYNLPPNGDESAIGQDIIYQCPEATQTWRLEIVANGQVIKKEVTIKNNGDLQ